MQVLVTGATGFIGRRLCASLSGHGYTLRMAVRRSLDKNDPLVNAGNVVNVGSLESDIDWESALHGVEAVVHLAAMTHIPRHSTLDQLQNFRRFNVQASISLFSAANHAGVKRFVYISSIGVNGSANVKPFTEDDAPNPVEPYARSKWEAEEALRLLAKTSATVLVIIRPPLVYGPGNPGNFLRLMKLLKSGLPLPFGAITAKRSYIGVDNLCDFIGRSLSHSRAAGNTFLIADNEDLDFRCVVENLAVGMGVRARLFRVPLPVLTGMARILGRSNDVEKISAQLLVDSAFARKTLDWQAPTAAIRGILETGKWFRHA